MSCDRIAPTLIGHYKKDESYEQMLLALNQSLASSHDQNLLELPEDYSTIHILGAPRSGTTLLSQLISANLDVGYINNFIASFWRAPCYGIQLSEKLLAGARPASYRSDLGRTTSIQEPHEFGYFWRYFLGYPEMAEQPAGFEQLIDWVRLRKVLINMTHAFDKPLVFKSFLLIWHLKRMQQVLPKSIFLWIRRDAIDNGLSILKAREAQLGSIDKWISLKPKEYDWLQHQPVPSQIAGQIFFTERAIADQVELIGSNNTLIIEYRDLCTNPQGVLEQLLAVLKNNGQTVKQINSPPAQFPFSASPTEHYLRDQLRVAYENLQAQAG